MKRMTFAVMACLAVFTMGCVSAQKVEMADLNGAGTLVKVNDARWDGKRVPPGEQGKKCGGTDPHFPSFTFDLAGLREHFQSKVVGIKMSAYDVDWPSGHHGKWRYLFDAEKETFISPEIPSETMDLPEGVKVISTHTAGRFSRGAYLAPSSCVAGGGHMYFTDIAFELENGETVTVTFSQGKY